MRRSVLTVLAVLLLFAGSACGDDNGGNGGGASGDANIERPSARSVPAGSPTVSVKGLQYKPKGVSIEADQGVTWKFEDGNIPHDVVFNELKVKSPVVTETEWSFVFEESGQFDYRCSLHPAMEGTVTVS